MADFEISIKKTLIHEGGFSDNPADPGHATNMGITQADMPGQDMHTLTVEQAVSYYRENYWKPLYNEILDQSVSDKLFDCGVLFGVGEAVKLIQTALGITSDGIFGPVTLLDLNAADPTSLLQGYKTLLVNYAISLTTENTKLRQFITGWIRRINS